MVKRPAQLPPRPPLTPDQIARAQYEGSPEHKIVRWWGGLPAAFAGDDGVAQRPNKQLTTICPLVGEVERAQATDWVKKALEQGQFRYFEGDKDFPKRVWYRDDAGQVWFGFCINSVLGTYKGWPIDEEERVEIFG
ncbi:hypothetical protein [Oryzibacter oryziterrae]|uniref:hypothetical protein n=1 Tax=Oryzibacter oryziterrae TaxID=2766474 RepID=UPI001F184808|nr:hypothetical protein [Oryzibacter oryziterrae]